MTPGYEMPMRNLNDELESIESNHSIVEFLRRPHLMMDTVLKNGNIVPLKDMVTSISAPQVPIFSYDLPWSLAKLGGKDKKIQNFEYFKADVKVKITVNANNMTSGRFWVTYAPVDTLIDKSFQISYKHRAGVTSYPGVEMDIQINNSIELTVPYLHWAEAMSTTSTNREQNSMAVLHMYPITPLRSAGDYSITVQVWGWFDNVTLVGPTPNTIRPAAASEELQLSNAIAKIKLSSPSEYRNTLNRLAVNIQVLNHKEKHNYARKREEAPGPITQIASKIGAAANIVKDIPLVSEVASTVSWISDIVGGVASVFGWSKPPNAEPVYKVQSVPGYGFAHAEGQDNGLILGLSQKNSLDLPNDAFTSAVDEMDIAYICANPGICAQAEWNTNQPIRTEIVGLKVNPYADHRVIQPRAEYYAPTACDFVASMFGLWRGTMCYRVVVTKTAFHSGRLEINFIPNQDGSLPVTTESTNTYRYIMDITNESEIVIRVPFFSESLMLPIANDYGFTGRLTIRPVTKLHAPNTVASVVDVSVWKWMEDPVFGVPSSDSVTVFVPTDASTRDNAVSAKMQIGFAEVVRRIHHPPKTAYGKTLKMISKWCRKFSEFISVMNLARSTRLRRKMLHLDISMQISVANVVDAPKSISFFENKTTDCIHVLKDVCGEAITNLRYLTRAFRFHSNVIANPNLELQPYDNTGNDYISYISHMYRYARGGLNFKIFANGYLSPFAPEALLKSSLVFTRGLVKRTPEHITFPAQNPMHEISVPFYSKYKRVPTVNVSTNKTPKVLVGQPYLPHIHLAVQGQSADNVRFDLYRAAKDDFSFGVLVGPPQLWRLKT